MSSDHPGDHFKKPQAGKSQAEQGGIYEEYMKLLAGGRVSSGR